MPDIKQTLQDLKAKGRVQGPAQPRKIDRSGKPRRPDEHLKQSVLEAEEEQKAAEPLPEDQPAPRKDKKEKGSVAQTGRRVEARAKVESDLNGPARSAESGQPTRRPDIKETLRMVEAREDLERQSAAESNEPEPPARQSDRSGASVATSRPFDDEHPQQPTNGVDHFESESTRHGASLAETDGQFPGPEVPALALVAQSLKTDATASNGLSDSAKELAAITRLLRADTCYYLAFLEMRDPSNGIVDLPHLAYAELFAVRKNTIAPMIKRLIDAGALVVERAYDAGSRTTWAYRVVERRILFERAPAPGAL